MKRCLVVVDVQNDFCPGGSLAVPDGDLVVPVINKLISQFNFIIFTKDWHVYNNLYFASSHEGKKPFDKMVLNGKEETLWPDHCIQNTVGSEFHKGLDFDSIAGDFYIFKKGITKNCHPYGGFGDEFEDTGLKEFLWEKEVSDLYITGLATEYCVLETALDSAGYGFNTVVIKDATRAIGDIKETMDNFKEYGVKVVEFNELPLLNIL